VSFLENLSTEYLEELYRQWQHDPASVGSDWQTFFQGFELGLNRLPEGQSASLADALKQSGVQSLIYRYRSIGHRLACTDPLSPCPQRHPQLELAEFGLSEDDLPRTFITRRYLKEQAPLEEILETLRETYCRSIGVEYMHIQDSAERQWLIDRMEPVRNRASLSGDERLMILERLQEATLFESFLHKKFLGQKRFSLEGGEVIIPLLDALVRAAAEDGVRDLIMGMSHRGRLNVLANILCKPLENIFAEFKDNLELGFVGDGDVKYHKGYSNDLEFPGGHRIHLSLAANPSHLEAVDPVVIGKCRARHVGYGPGGKKRVLPVLLHGDAAFAGQGMVSEVLNLSQLDGYQSGGTVHVVINNQIGFTTEPTHARSTLYATDVAKMLSVPIFHVNGEDPEAAVYVARLALEYRQRFGKDVVVEVICYRRHGHNEGDEPSFTQPLMYEKIKGRPALHTLYGERLVKQGIAADQVEQQEQAIQKRLEAALESDLQPQQIGFSAKWEKIQREYAREHPDTSVPQETLDTLAARITTVPNGFNAHPKVAKLLEKRRDNFNEDTIDWGLAEHLGFASLLVEKVPIRLSGQDSRRGTFNQRHAVLVDQKSAQLAAPLAFLKLGQADFQVYNSMLSEAAVLGFEYGYSLETPNGLTIWEAQFGDFVNGAQVIIDQFIAGSGTKWDRSSGLVMYLPHGYEGQGPEHSSARIERFLSLCADFNMLVAYPSTPAQLFHLLRRQVKFSFRRPLVVFTPKSLLRHPSCVSSREELATGSFQTLIPEGSVTRECTTLLMCSGKIYFDLREKLDEQLPEGLALVRLEQLYPLDCVELESMAKKISAQTRLVWLQEEPQNMGAWSYLALQLECLFERRFEYVGRKAAAATAVGSHRRHQQEQQELIDRVMEIITRSS